MSLARYRFIAVEGPIGAGKTTLARRLAERLGGEPLLEDPDANPFLARFYEDMARYALPTQLFFLFQRFEQLRAVAQHDLFARVRVADFLLEKDPLFAGLTLAGDELALYQRLYDALALRAPRPDLVIYLQAGPRTLAERVRRRAVEYERAIEADYLERLADAYARFFHQYDEAPVLAVNSEHLDFAASERDLGLLLDHLATMRGRREFFNVGI
jgi:deoxyguanosine kinase